MAIRGDITVDWGSSPRVITVAAPSVEIDAQDLHDTCRSLEASGSAMDNKVLVQSSGFEDLGGGTKVGLTVTLQNALVAFEARLGPEYVQCNVSGGNCVAVDGLGVPLTTPISPTAFTQVVVTASSSATSSSQRALETGLFMGAVCVDVTSTYSGTGHIDGYPIGVRSRPVNNFSDAIAVAAYNSIKQIQVLSSATLVSTDFSEGFVFVGDNAVTVALTLDAGANVANCEFRNLTVTGILDGSNVIRDCAIGSLTYTSGYIHRCSINGIINIAPDVQATIMDSFSGVAGGGDGQYAGIDMGGSGKLALRNYNGGMVLTNYTGGGGLSIDMSSGRVVIDPTVTAGDVYVRGICELVDNSTGTAVIHDKTETTVISENTWAQLKKVIANIWAS